MATVQASIAGGAWSSGGITASLNNTLDLRLADYTGVSSIRWELLDFPPDFTVPSGWSTAADGTFYSTSPTPAQFVMDEWGKYMIRCIVNGGVTVQADGSVVEDQSLRDEATCVRILSPNAIDDMGITERTQWYAREAWAGGFKRALRTIDTWMAGVVTWDPLGFVRRALGSPPATPAAGNIGVFGRGADDAHARLAYISAAGTVRDCLTSDGSVPLTAAWNVGSFGVTAASLTATTGDVTATAGKVTAGTDVEATSGKFVALATNPTLYHDANPVAVFQIGDGTGAGCAEPGQPSRTHATGATTTTDDSTWTSVCSMPRPSSHDTMALVGIASSTSSGGKYRRIECASNTSGPVGTIYYGGDGSAANIQILVSAYVWYLQVKGTAATTLYWVGKLDEAGAYLD